MSGGHFLYKGFEKDTREGIAEALEGLWNSCSQEAGVMGEMNSCGVKHSHCTKGPDLRGLLILKVWSCHSSKSDPQEFLS